MLPCLHTSIPTSQFYPLPPPPNVVLGGNHPHITYRILILIHLDQIWSIYIYITYRLLRLALLQGRRQRGAGGRLPPQYSSRGGLAPPINRSYDDRMCVAAAACTRCVSKRTTTIYMYACVQIVAPPPLLRTWQFACRVRAYIGISPPHLRTAAAASVLDHKWFIFQSHYVCVKKFH